MIKKQEGITLSALVITIVVMLIIAGSALGMIFDEKGMIKSSQESKELQESYSNSQEEKTNDLIDNINEEMKDIAKKGKLVPGEERYIVYIDSSSNEKVPIPGGYCVVNDGKKQKNNIATGLVISDVQGDDMDNTKGGNQFVWVPVNNDQLKSMYGIDSNGVKHGKLYNFTASGKSNLNWTETNGIMSIQNINGNREPDIITSYDGNTTYLNILTNPETKTADAFKAQLQSEFNKMIDSVEKYKGFYIGRYETGSLSNTNRGNKPVVKKGAIGGNSSWYYTYQESKNIAKEKENVFTSIIWGCQFDRVLSWIAETNGVNKDTPNYSIITNSSSWGNYSNYSTVTGDTSTTSGGTTILATGTNGNWQKNSIYDLAGNLWECTIEANSTNIRVLRGRSLLYRWS